MAEERNIERAFFTDAKLPPLPTHIEANPLSAAQDGFSWADMIAVATPPLAYEEILNKIGIPPGDILACPTQVLVDIPMPCGGLGECGVCTIKGVKNKSLLACEDGPVFIFTSSGFQKKR